ncbi:cobalamin biosynthesis protein CobD [Fulvimarina pelagi HTCC2506]|uniref:Cobalamin biosynthesis protein CobD n=1 Tax=Fulvimarina pelagi HTCC2506 TaxID=314231 RepID=Q0G4E5_9HYPH|nr:adenosylcobinamide-phosphate synthase CbiB [Fulvimarina pelagi]EAU41536.1 cobalamin biosynthesis protein CobD [Fulvimarina pelagi HTCC2506]
MATHFTLLFFATLLDRIVGDPETIWRHFPHPVVVFGRVIDYSDARLNDPSQKAETRRRNGLLFLVGLVVASTLTGLGLSALFDIFGPFGFVAEIALVSVFLAQKSLLDHVKAVATALAEGGLHAGRREVAKIVGRDVDLLDESGVSRAAIESLAENASDGIVAPFFWYLVLGLPGMLVYKAVNTADSMIGHINEKYSDFGRASAKFDDALNYVPARITAWLFLRVGVRDAVKRSERRGLVRRDAPLHRSPNAGWPETAAAVALDIALGGPRRYGALVVDAPYLNPDGRRDIERFDIEAALRLTRKLFDRLLWASAALAMLALILS